MNERTRFTIRLADDSPILLDHAYPRERVREFAERLIRAVESDEAELVGDGKRNHAPVELDALLNIPGGSRADHAKRAGEIERDLPTAAALEFDDLTFPVLRARVMSVVPIDDNGYKIGLRFYSAQHDFQDSAGRAVPLI